VVKKIGELKKQEDIPLRNVDVEDSQIQELRIQGEALGLDSDFVEDIFRRTIAYAIEVEEKMGV
jgi:chorismate mutase